MVVGRTVSISGLGRVVLLCPSPQTTVKIQPNEMADINSLDQLEKAKNPHGADERILLPESPLRYAGRRVWCTLSNGWCRAPEISTRGVRLNRTIAGTVGGN
jgi:hypothetical protein